MARADFAPYDTRGQMGAISSKYSVENDGTASILAGEMVRVDQGGGDGEYVQLEVDGGSNTTIKIGVAASDSNETTAADGIVWVYDNPLQLYKGRASTAGNLTSSIRLTQVTIDVAAGTNGRQTIDEDDTSNGSYRIYDFDATAGMVVFGMAILDNISAG